jgi:hypothetical protein
MGFEVKYEFLGREAKYESSGNEVTQKLTDPILIYKHQGKELTVPFAPTKQLCQICEVYYGVCEKGLCSGCIEMEMGLLCELTKKIYREILTRNQYAKAEKLRQQEKNSHLYAQLLVSIFDGKSKGAEMLKYCQDIPELPMPEEFATIMKEKWEPMLLLEDDAWRIMECIYRKMKNFHRNYEYTHLIASRTVDYWQFHRLYKPRDHKWWAHIVGYYEAGRKLFQEEKIFKILARGANCAEVRIDWNLYIEKMKDTKLIEASDDNLCVICQEKKARFVPILCRHKCLCLICYNRLTPQEQPISCPICRQNADHCIYDDVWDKMKANMLK